MGLGASVAAVPETAGIANALGPCSRVSIAEEVKTVYSAQLGPWPQPQQLPMVYSDIYNIGFGGVRVPCHMLVLNSSGSGKQQIKHVHGMCMATAAREDTSF